MKMLTRVTAVCMVVVLLMNSNIIRVFADSINGDSHSAQSEPSDENTSELLKDSSEQNATTNEETSDTDSDTDSVASSTSEETEQKNAESSEAAEQTKEELAPTTLNSIAGTWGTSPYTFDEDTGILTIESGTTGIASESPWNRSGDTRVIPANIKKIVLSGNVVANALGARLFASMGSTPLVALEQIEGNLDTSQVTTMFNMFAGASSLTSIDVSGFDTSNVTAMNGMFTGTTSLKELNLASFDTSKVTNMSNMFMNVPLEKVTLGDNFKFVGTNAQLGIPYLDGIAKEKWIREDGNSKAYLPADFIANYGTGDLTAGTYVAEVTLWGTCPYEFDETTGTLTIYSGTTGTFADSPWDRNDDKKIDAASVKKIVLSGKVVANINSNFLFSSNYDFTNGTLTGLEQIEGELDTSQVTSMYGMFYGMSSLKKFDISGFDTSKVTNMGYMFANMRSIISLDLSGFDTSKVARMESMFQGASGLTSIDLSGFDTSQVSSMTYMFISAPIEKLTLGAKFKFVGSNSGLTTPVYTGTGTATGKWAREDGTSIGYTPADFIADYGTGDLTAGTYVAEEQGIASLSLGVVFDKTAYTIGDTITTMLTVKHTLDSAENSIATNVAIEDLTKFTLDGAQELPEKVVVEKYNANNELISSTEQTISSAVSLADLAYGEYYNLKVIGQAWNNTKVARSNYSIMLDYNDGIESTSQTISGLRAVASGVLTFTSVPTELNFKNTKLSLNLNGQLIDRQETDWALLVADYRGTNPLSDTDATIDRTNWEITATAEEFKDSDGNSIDTSAMAIAYVKDGEIAELSSTSEQSIKKHDVTGETPKDNHETSVSWDADEGLKAVVRNRNKLKTATEYTAQLNFELRMAP